MQVQYFIDTGCSIIADLQQILNKSGQDQPRVYYAFESVFVMG